MVKKWTILTEKTESDVVILWQIAILLSYNNTYSNLMWILKLFHNFKYSLFVLYFDFFLPVGTHWGFYLKI